MYNWKRFWCPITGKLKFDHLGFLADPEDYGYITNPDVVPFTDISHIPCLVLLGEAGIGKTTAAKQEYTQRLEQVRDSDDECLWFELGEYETDTRLCQKIFENQTVQTWRKGSNKLYLFLDSLDEGLLSIQILVRILKREIENLPCERLYLRITCRTADWSDIAILNWLWQFSKLKPLLYLGFKPFTCCILFRAAIAWNKSLNRNGEKKMSVSINLLPCAEVMLLKPQNSQT